GKKSRLLAVQFAGLNRSQLVGRITKDPNRVATIEMRSRPLEKASFAVAISKMRAVAAVVVSDFRRLSFFRSLPAPAKCNIEPHFESVSSRRFARTKTLRIMQAGRWPGR